MGNSDLVLVVDDDPGFLVGIERLLRAHGLEVEVFESAEAFQNRVNSHDALCLVLDINLGKASGIELRLSLSSSGLSLPVIFITGNDNDAVRTVALEAGCVAYLPKPFTGAALMDAIEKARVASERQRNA